VNEHRPIDPVTVLAQTREALTEAMEAMAEARAIVESLKIQNAWLTKQVDLARKRSIYPEFCKHPGKCAGEGRCMAKWCCND